MTLFCASCVSVLYSKEPFYRILVLIAYTTNHSLYINVQVPTCIYSKTCLKRPLKKKTKIVFKTGYRLMQVKKFCNNFDLH